jgi:hypothetical protein
MERIITYLCLINKEFHTFIPLEIIYEILKKIPVDLFSYILECYPNYKWIHYPFRQCILNKFSGSKFLTFPQTYIYEVKISSSADITYEQVKFYPGRPWNYLLLSNNTAITYEDIMSDPNKPWDLPQILKRKDISNKKKMKIFRKVFLRKRNQIRV